MRGMFQAQRILEGFDEITKPDWVLLVDRVTPMCWLIQRQARSLTIDQKLSQLGLMAQVHDPTSILKRNEQSLTHDKPW